MHRFANRVYYTQVVHVYIYIENIRCCQVIDLDKTVHFQTPRRELKIQHAAEYFLTNFEVFRKVAKQCLEFLIDLLITEVSLNIFRRKAAGFNRCRKLRTELLCKRIFLLDGQTSWVKLS